MSSWLLAVVAVNFMLQAAVSASRPLTSVRAIGLGATSFDLGLIAASYAVLALLVAVPIGRMIDRWGAAAFVISGSILLAAMLLATAFSNSTILLIVIQSGIGLALINANLGMQSTIASTATPQKSASAFGNYSTAAGIGLLAGPAVAGLLVAGAETPAPGVAPDSEATDFAFLILTLIAIAATAIAALLPVLGVRTERRTGHALTTPPGWSWLGQILFRQRGVREVLIASASFITCLDLLAIYLPAYGLEHGYSVSYVGFLLSVSAAGSVAARALSSPVIRTLGRARVMRLSLYVPAAALVLLPLLPGVLMPLEMAIIGLGLGFGQPLTMSWIASLATPETRAATLGVRVSGNRVGQLVIPLLIAAVISVTSLSAGFWALALLLAGTALLFGEKATSEG